MVTTGSVHYSFLDSKLPLLHSFFQEKSYQSRFHNNWLEDGENAKPGCLQENYGTMLCGNTNGGNGGKNALAESTLH